MSTNWADLNKDGKRLETIIRHLHKKFKHADGDPQLMISFAQTIRSLTHEKVEVAKTVLGVKDVLSKAMVTHDVH